MTSQGPRAGERRAGTVFGHPVGLANLLGVEMWERFSFYGMLTILGYYLYFSVTDGGLQLPRTTAVGIVGAYGGLVYLSTVLGGWVADRLLGMERTIFYGGVCVLAGHVVLAVVPGMTGLAAGLLSVAVGSGGVKANAAALLGTLYQPADPRRDGGFTLFYFGANLGALIGPLVTGLLQTRLGFHYGFGAAAVGMAAGLAQYLMFRRNLGGAGRGAPHPLPPSRYGRIAAIALGAVVVIAAVTATGWVRLDDLAEVTAAMLVAVSVGYFVVLLSSAKVTGAERLRVRAFVAIFLANVVFAALFQQIFTVLAVYSAERIDWSVSGWTAPPSLIGSIEPVWLIVLAPLFAALWTRLGSRAPSTPHKMAYAVVGIGVAFLLFVPLAGFTGRSVPVLLVAAIMVVVAVAELLLAPIGMSVTTQLAPAAFRAQMMALYFFSVGLGTAISGVLGRFYAPGHEVVYFGLSGAVAVVAGLVLFALAPRISTLMNGVH
ncbi:MFS transporter [Mycolicibacterium litorale]|nr:MFS transporter [Mycolicibacterium litorale]